MYHVVMECFSFNTYEEAVEFQETLITAFCQMEKSEGISAINRIDLVEGETD